MGDLSRRYPPTWRGVPPSMPAGDYRVWRAWLDGPGLAWPEYAYDVELHGGPSPIADADPTMARAWARLVAKRVDAIGIRADGLTLFETRHNAAWQSLGQLLGYRELLPLDYPGEIIAGAVIVTDQIDPSIRRVALLQGLRVEIVSVLP